MFRLSYVTHFYCEKSLRVVDEVFDAYRNLPSELTDQIEFIVVDDGSPLQWTPPDGLNLRLVKIQDNIPWNLAAARNIGITLARSDAVFVTDIDHRVPEKTLRYLVHRGVRRRHLVRFYRKREGTLLNPHASTFLLSRSRFLELHGYDEEFCGHYGYEETMFFRWQRLNGTFCYRAPKRFFVHVCDGDEHSLERDPSRNSRVWPARAYLPLIG